jgi:hypothetical protein
MKGCFNKILRINLKTKTFKEESVPDSVYEAYLGGKGLGTHLLMKENPPGVNQKWDLTLFDLFSIVLSKISLGGLSIKAYLFLLRDKKKDCSKEVEKIS